jgi:hypothetical protein
MLIDKKSADEFLFRYKAVMAFLNDGAEPVDIELYAALRSHIFEKIAEIAEDVEGIAGPDFVHALKSGLFGKFIYLKKYQKGYILKHVDSGKYYEVVALTTPLEEIVPEYSVIDTAIIPYANRLMCDGLVCSYGIYIGKNMAREIRDGYWLARRAGELVKTA